MRQYRLGTERQATIDGRLEPLADVASSPVEVAARDTRTGDLFGPKQAELFPIQPAELCTRQTYAVEADVDLEQLRAWPPAHRAELLQISVALECSITLAALLVLMIHFHGLHRGGAPGDRRRLNGRGLQIPLRALVAMLAASKATVCRALLEGAERGWIERYAATRKVERITNGRLSKVRTKDGQDRDRINVHGVLYLTPAGARAVEGKGYSAVLRADRTRREKRAIGVVGFLLRTLAPVLRAIAVRCASAPTRETPYVDLHPQNQLPVVVAGGIVERTRAGPSRSGSAPPDGVAIGQQTAGPTPSRGAASATALELRSSASGSTPLRAAIGAVLLETRGHRAARALEGGGLTDLELIHRLFGDELAAVLKQIPGPDVAWGAAHWRSQTDAGRRRLAELFEQLRRAAR